jgi:hypothetical protein
MGRSAPNLEGTSSTAFESGADRWPGSDGRFQRLSKSWSFLGGLDLHGSSMIFFISLAEQAIS